MVATPVRLRVSPLLGLAAFCTHPTVLGPVWTCWAWAKERWWQGCTGEVEVPERGCMPGHGRTGSDFAVTARTDDRDRAAPQQPPGGGRAKERSATVGHGRVAPRACCAWRSVDSGGCLTVLGPPPSSPECAARRLWRLLWQLLRWRSHIIWRTGGRRRLGGPTPPGRPRQTAWPATGPLRRGGGCRVRPAGPARQS